MNVRSFYSDFDLRSTDVTKKPYHLDHPINAVLGRRRKIRCTYAPTRPGICNECHARGSSCIDQEHAPLRPEAAKLRIGDQSYSLRERVAALEHTVSKLVKQMDESDKGRSKEAASWSYTESPTDSIDRGRYYRISRSSLGCLT